MIQSPGRPPPEAGPPYPEVVPAVDSSAALAEELRAAIGSLVRRTRAADVLPGSQAAALGLLDREGAATIAELASRSGVRHQSMSRVVGQLREHGAVRSAADPRDGRSVLLHITEPGSRLLDQDRRRRADQLAGAIDAELDAAEREQLARAVELLQRLTARIEHA